MWTAQTPTAFNPARTVRHSANHRLITVRYVQIHVNRPRSFFDQLALDRLEPVLDLDGQTTRRYGVVGLPVTFFIDAQGVIRHIERGEVMDQSVIREGIAKAQ